MLQGLPRGRKQGDGGRFDSRRLRRPNGFGPSALQQPKILGGHGGKSFERDPSSHRRAEILDRVLEREAIVERITYGMNESNVMHIRVRA
jgi:hypothetical protein